MNLESLNRCFVRMGARVKFGSGGLDVLRDDQGEFFRLNLDQARADGYHATDVRPCERHLVLLGRSEDTVERFLCGHDERHWFAASVPGAGVAKVAAAMDALQPLEVRRSRLRAGVSHRRRHRRHNAGFVRQGEWFFIPRPDFVLPNKVILRHEPLLRRGKPHIAEELCRVGGETVFVHKRYPSGLTLAQFERLTGENSRTGWRQMKRNPTAYVRGRVRHPDHATVVLPGWHLVQLSAEAVSANLTFLD